MKSIRTKLWIGMMVLVGIVIILLWLFQIVFLEKFYAALEIRNVARTAEEIAYEIGGLESIYTAGESGEVVDSIDNFAYAKGLGVYVADVSGKIIYQNDSSSGSSYHGIMREAYLEAASAAISGKESRIEAVHPRFGNKFMIIAVPVSINGEIQGFMMITMTMLSVEDTVDILEKQLVIITAILLLVAAAISFRLSRIFAGPVIAIGKTAESYASGNYAARVEGDYKGIDEIARLAGQMNDMGEKLAENEKLQKELIANVSHELRTPLTLIRGYAETLRDVTGGIPEKREKQLNIIIEESERLGVIVDDILNLSQLQAGAAVLNKEAFSLGEMLDDIRRRYELQEEKRTFHIRGVEEISEKLVGDRRRLEQVFYNLINNAFRHTDKEGLVEVSAVKKKGHVRIEVRDTGSGIAPEDLGHVFERYYKGRREEGTKASGTGLGLAIVKSILEMHGIPYGVESALGKGTMFWFEVRTEGR